MIGVDDIGDDGFVLWLLLFSDDIEWRSLDDDDAIDETDDVADDVGDDETLLRLDSMLVPTPTRWCRGGKISLRLDKSVLASFLILCFGFIINELVEILV